MSREIEDRLRAALSAKTERIGEGDLRPQHLPGRRVRTASWSRRSLPWLAPVFAAAAIVVIVVGVADRSTGRQAASNNSEASSSSSQPPGVRVPAPSRAPSTPVSPDSANVDKSLQDAGSLPAPGFSVPSVSGQALKDLPSAVLGSSDYWAGGNTRGFGTAHPGELNTNGDPSGIVLGITWHNWGSATAAGIGQTYLPKPGSGYYSGTVPIELRATDLGRCGSVVGYRELLYRVPVQPGGQPTGPWQLWANAKNLCESR